MSIVKDDKHMNNTLDASQLLHTLAEHDTEKRHADDHQDTSTLPVVSNPSIIAWLRGLAPLTDKQLYDTAWKD